MNADPRKPITGLWWNAAPDGRTEPLETATGSLYDLNHPFTVVKTDDGHVAAFGGSLFFNRNGAGPEAVPVAGQVMPCPVRTLGDPGFCDDYGLDYPYIAGSMANGLSSVEMVEAMARAGMLGFFGAGGLPVSAIEKAVVRLRESLGDLPYGFNLIHSPNEPEMERATVELYLNRRVRLVEASAYMDLTLPLVTYRVKGIYRDPDGKVQTPNRIIAKASRVEVATRFFSPPPENMLRELVASGVISENQAEMAREIPMACDLTAEADSGGHTDNRPAITLIPTMMSLRDRMAEEYGYDRPLRVGAAGGIASPISALAAFSMGAAYVLTGSVNQCTREAGTCDLVRDMLSKTGQADITMAPAADMFEMGVKVQVLKWGTMFPMRAARLFELYKNYPSLDGLPEQERTQLEKNVFRSKIEDIWEQTRAYFLSRDPGQVDLAQNDPKHRMALVFRWYLGQTSGWANQGDISRKIDFQIFCGPAMGAFNEWVKGTFLEGPENRDVVTIALNLLFGAALYSRVRSLRRQGIDLPGRPDALKPQRLEKIKEYLE